MLTAKLMWAMRGMSLKLNVFKNSGNPYEHSAIMSADCIMLEGTYFVDTIHHNFVHLIICSKEFLTGFRPKEEMSCL